MQRDLVVVEGVARKARALTILKMHITKNTNNFNSHYPNRAVISVTLLILITKQLPNFYSFICFCHLWDCTEGSKACSKVLS